MMYRVESIMSKPAITVDAQARVADALELMRQKNISSLIVNPVGLDDSYGILTKRDIVTKVVARDLDPRYLFVAEIMTKPVIKISPESSLRECSILMGKANVRRLPVFAGDHLVGIISDTDIFQCVEERGWGPEAAPIDEEPFLASVRGRIRAALAQSRDPDAVASAIMLGISELYRALKKM
ncbi:MAG: CBS domain-containing protein [Chloroflexi bacterium]|nr:CBS domain-containing protein [Chloroflexota bacterium]MBI3742391.1 CBS domain-containing protein [Chloroflexota bacterium]